MSPDTVETKLADLARAHDLSGPRVQAMGARLRPAADRGELSETSYWRAVLEPFDVTPSAEDLDFERYLQVHEEALALARQLTRQLKVGILSNDTREMAAARRRLMGIDERFAPIIVSADLGLTKPDAAIYLVALDAAGCSAGRCLFIDDRPENVRGARAVGMLALQYRGVEDLRRRLAQEFSLTVED